MFPRKIERVTTLSLSEGRLFTDATHYLKTAVVIVNTNLKRSLDTHNAANKITIADPV